MMIVLKISWYIHNISLTLKLSVQLLYIKANCESTLVGPSRIENYVAKKVIIRTRISENTQRHLLFLYF